MRTFRTTSQDAIMLDFMKANRDIATDFRAATRAKWDELHKRLNLAGPPVKELSGWKKIWKNRKISVRQKLAKNKDLTTNEKTLALICGMYQDRESQGDRVKNEPLSEEEFLTEDEKENRSEDRKELEPKPKGRRLSSSRHISMDSQYISPTSSELHSQQPMSEILKTLQELTAQQANHFRKMETIELQKLEVAKTISENIAKFINK